MRSLRTRPRLFAGLLAASVAVLTGVVVGSPLAASAANGTPDDISTAFVGDMTVTPVDPGDDTTNVWDGLRVEFALDSRLGGGDSTVDEGDFFRIEFPEEIIVPTTTMNLMGDGVVLATCVASTETRDIVCTMTKEAAEREWVAGKLSVEVLVGHAEGQEDFEVKVGNDVIIGTFPGGPVQAPVPIPWPGETSKWGWQVGEQPDQLQWYVAVRSDEFAPGAPIVITDTLSGPTTLVGAPDVTLRTYPTQADWEADRGTIVTVPLGTSDITITPGRTTTATLEKLDDQSFRLTFDNEMPGEAVYLVGYRSTVTEGTLSGQVTSNSADVNGTVVTDRTVYLDKLAGDLNGPGTGGFVLSKLLSGEAADLGEGREFTVVATWQDAAGAQQERELTVIGGGAGAQLTGLPVGTVVTLSELTTTAIEGVESYVPTFSSTDGAVRVSADGTTAELTIQDRVQLSVVVTNALVPVTPEPTPTPTPTPTPEPTPTPTTSTPPVPTPTPSTSTPPVTPPVTPEVGETTAVPPVPSTPASTPPALAATGQQVLPWIPAIAVVALAAGAVLVARRRSA